MFSPSKVNDVINDTFVNDAFSKPKKVKSISYRKYGYFFVMPFIIFFFLFSFYPTAYTFIISFFNKQGKDADTIGKFIFLKNYKDVVLDKSFWNTILVTLKIWGLNVVLQFGFALVLAAIFNDQSLKIKGKGLFKFAYYLPNIVTAATVGLLFRQMLQTEGTLNSILLKIVKNWERKDFLLDKTITQTTVSLVLTWIWYGNTMIVLLAGMAGINPTLYEAARIDGASSVRQFFSITLPLLKSILLYAFVTSLAGGLQMYDVPFFFVPTSHTQTVAIKLYQWGFTGINNYGRSAAGSIIMLIITMLISSVLFWIMNVTPEKKKTSKV
ncbi:MAG TPA: sugar ABC transporter permease [Clostridia bacterium]